MKIYSYPNNPRVAKSLIAANFNDVKVEFVEIADFPAGTKTPEYLKKNPNGKVPVLETEEGCIFESNAILRYVGRLGCNCLYGKNDFEAGQVEMWIEWALNEVESSMIQWIGPIKGFAPYNPAAMKKAKETLTKLMEILNNYLLPRTFLVGESISLADISLCCTLYPLFSMVFDEQFRKPFPNVVRYYMTCTHQPEFAPLGEAVLCEKAMQAEPPKKKQGKKEKKGKAAKPEPSEAAPAAAPAEKKERQKNPLDILPKSKLDLEEWKRVYSNEDTRSVAIPWFWETYDPEGYCLYELVYKYNDELKMTFMSSNLVRGFFQRLDNLRKYGFGVSVIIGENNGSQEIRAMFLFRGKTVPAEMIVCDDFELYDARALDHTDAATRSLVENYLACDEVEIIPGKPILDAKVFK